MKQKINITIPEPCHENWQNMNPTERGRFCGSCQKNVIDFTKASDRQIIEAYKKETNLCGRFLNTQLDRELVVPKEKSSVWLATTSAVLSLLSLESNEVIAQEIIKTEQTDKKVISKDSYSEISDQEKDITGIVVDASGPMPGVNVIVKGTQRRVPTNFDGKYSIKAKEGETLVFSFMGMKEETIVVGSATKYDVTMKDDGVFLGGAVVTAGFGILKPTHTKKHFWRNSAHTIEGHTFLGRVFHSIGNWFR